MCLFLALACSTRGWLWRHPWPCVRASPRCPTALSESECGVAARAQGYSSHSSAASLLCGEAIGPQVAESWLDASVHAVSAPGILHSEPASEQACK